MSIAYGAVVGAIMLFATRFASRRYVSIGLRVEKLLITNRKWIDVESYLLVPTAIGLFAVGTGGLIGTDDLLACFVAGSVLNWDGEYLKECERKHDEVNGTIDVILNLGGFAYIGMISKYSPPCNSSAALIDLPKPFRKCFPILRRC